MINNARMSESGIEEMESLWEVRIHSYECAFGQIWWDFWKKHPASTGMRPFHIDNFSSLNTLCGDYITCNVHRIVTSWRRKLPRFRLAACLTEHSASFNVLIRWLCGPCKGHVREKKSQHEISEPIGISRRIEMDSMSWWKDVPDAEALGKVVVLTLYVWLVEYII